MSVAAAAHPAPRGCCLGGWPYTSAQTHHIKHSASQHHAAPVGEGALGATLVAHERFEDCPDWGPKCVSRWSLLVGRFEPGLGVLEEEATLAIGHQKAPE